MRALSEYEHDQPVVTVYNHAKWSSAIKELVFEVMAFEKRIQSYQIQKEKDYSFILDQIDYEKVEKSKKLSQKSKPISTMLPQLSTQQKITTMDTTYHKFKENSDVIVSTKIESDIYTVDELVNDVKSKLALFDEEEGTDYLKKFYNSS